MKKLLFLYLILQSTIFNACAQNTGQLPLKQGDKLFYEVTDGEATYGFNMKIKAFQTKAIAFDWEIPQQQLTGTINMNETAVTSAKGTKTLMSKGTVNLSNESCAWLSTSIFGALKKGENVTLNIDGTPNNFKLLRAETYPLEQYELTALVFSNADNSKKIWVLDDASNPLILKMTLDFEIQLIKVKKD